MDLCDFFVEEENPEYRDHSLFMPGGGAGKIHHNLEQNVLTPFQTKQKYHDPLAHNVKNIQPHTHTHTHTPDLPHTLPPYAV